MSSSERDPIPSPTYCPNCGHVDLNGNELVQRFSELLAYAKRLEYIGNRARPECCGTCKEMAREAEEIRKVLRHVRMRFPELALDLLASGAIPPKRRGTGE